MKNVSLLYLLFILCYLQRTHAQSYVPFPVDSVTWGVEEIYYVIDPPDSTNSIVYSEYYYRINGDTVISNLAYHKLNEIDGNTGFTVTKGFLREDSLKRIHFFSNEFPQDFVIYDFDLNLDDSIVVPFSFFLDQMTLKVTTIDSVLVSGTYRKRIFLEEVFNGLGLYTHEWIEGIGSVSHGLLYPEIWPVDMAAHLTCFSNKDINYLTACPLNVSTEELLIEKSEIKLFPNPAKDYFEVQLNTANNSQTFDLSLASTNGKLFYKVSDVKFPAIINTTGWPSGVYIVNVGTQHSALTCKLFKE